MQNYSVGMIIKSSQFATVISTVVITSLRLENKN